MGFRKKSLKKGLGAVLSGPRSGGFGEDCPAPGGEWRGKDGANSSCSLCSFWFNIDIEPRRT